jgi:hypothetical protein
VDDLGAAGSREPDTLPFPPAIQIPASLVLSDEGHQGVEHVRHAYGKHCVDVGADIRAIAEALGHESLESTKIYTQVSFERTRALAALFDAPGGKIIPVDPARKVRKMHEG